MLKIAVFGAGHLGKFHLNNWLEIEGITLVGFYDPDDKNAEIVEEKYKLKRFTNPEELLDAALRFAQARLSPPTLEQIGVIAALDCPQSYYDNVREEYRARRDTLLERVARIPGAKAPKVEGAFYATVRLPIDDGDDFCQWLLESFDLNGKTVMMAPASGFYSTPGEGKDEVRIAYVLNREKMNEAMDILEAALKVYPGRREPVLTQ